VIFLLPPVEASHSVPDQDSRVDRSDRDRGRAFSVVVAVAIAEVRDLLLRDREDQLAHQRPGQMVHCQPADAGIDLV
jgi:hypothetical protein